jgi:hypothetical protein
MHTTRLRTAVRTAAAIATTTFAAVSLHAQKTPNLAPYLIADRNAEIALARTAAPAHVSDSATVLVLTRTGFVEGAHGTNGFTCMVLRSFAADIGDSNFWNARVRAPHCLNPAATRSVLPEMLKRAEWIMAGVPTADIATRTERAYASHDFPMPAPGAMAFMLSHDQYLANDNPHWLPHLMFYFDKSISGKALGAGGEKPTIIDGSGGGVRSPTTTLIIPVRRWSDGTPADAK